jgi:hypothetical protein
MEKRLRSKIDAYLQAFKDDVKSYIESHDISESTEKLCNYIDNYVEINITSEDFIKRKRVKNIVPSYDRCKAKRSDGDRCTRRKKKGGDYCGTHCKGQPHGVIDEEQQKPTFKKITVKAQDIKGIVYYIDNHNNVYDSHDIICGVRNPKVIAKYAFDGETYNIPEFGI